MVDCLLDTNILIDFLRNHPPAIAWKNSLGTSILGITSIVYMEVIEGTLNKSYLNHALNFLSQFQIIYLTADDQTWAINQVAKFHLSHNIDLTDALIAAPVFRLKFPFYSLNTKHFLPMIPVLVQQPY
jgi:predicted nucleic acid-binding protein